MNLRHTVQNFEIWNSFLWCTVQRSDIGSIFDPLFSTNIATSFHNTIKHTVHWNLLRNTVELPKGPKRYSVFNQFQHQNFSISSTLCTKICSRKFLLTEFSEKFYKGLSICYAQIYMAGRWDFDWEVIKVCEACFSWLCRSICKASSCWPSLGTLFVAIKLCRKTFLLRHLFFLQDNEIDHPRSF